jgi:hypothetical protein
VEFLLDRGVDPGLQNDDGQTGLLWAAYGTHLDVVKLLLRRGSPVDVKDQGFHAKPWSWRWSPGVTPRTAQNANVATKWSLYWLGQAQNSTRTGMSTTKTGGAPQRKCNLTRACSRRSLARFRQVKRRSERGGGKAVPDKTDPWR